MEPEQIHKTRIIENPNFILMYGHVWSVIPKTGKYKLCLDHQ